MSNGLQNQRKEVNIEICPEDVPIILPFKASDVAAHKCCNTRSRRQNFVNGTPEKKRLKCINENDEGSGWSDSSEDFLERPVQKNELFGHGDVEGKKLFPLTPTTPKNRMVSRSATNQTGSYSATKVSTPKNKTPSSLKKCASTSRKSNPKRSLKEQFLKSEQRSVTPSPPKYTVPNTPYGLRQRLKRGIQNAYIEDRTESDLDSDYDDSDETDDESSNTSSEDEDEKENPKSNRKPIIRLPVAPSKKAAKKEINYVCSARDYFHLKGSRKKDKTSDNILSQLENPSLSHNQFRSILRKITQSHEKEVRKIHETLHYEFNKWMFFLSQNYSVILYGLGSKKNILDTFRTEMLPDSKVLVVNGFFPSITLKEILDSITKELLKVKEAAPNSSFAVDQIKRRLDDYKSAPHIFLIINNIDGPSLRDEKCQNALSSLASHKKIHLVASVDHINAPLIWDVTKLGNLSPVWIDATTFLPYIDEVSFENSFLVKHSGSKMALASLINVYKSLTSNAKKVYRILVEDHLDNIKNKSYRGMTLLKLYNAAKRDFIVSSDLALRTLLTEFFDHQLVKDRKDSDCLTIPLETSVLMKFMDLQNESST